MSDDMTFCFKDCNNMNCSRNNKHIQHPELMHSYSFFEGTDECLNTQVKEKAKKATESIFKYSFDECEKALSEIGIKMKDDNNNIKPVGIILQELADIFKKCEDSNGKVD